jgi:hypothetical protein
MLSSGPSTRRSARRATNAELVGKIIHLRQNYHLGPGTASDALPNELIKAVLRTSAKNLARFNAYGVKHKRNTSYGPSPLN